MTEFPDIVQGDAPRKLGLYTQIGSNTWMLRLGQNTSAVRLGKMESMLARTRRSACPACGRQTARRRRRNKSR